MKPTFMCLAASMLAIASPAAAQEYLAPGGVLGAYDGYYEYDAPVPPRPVPNYVGDRVETVVTTTRRIITQPGYISQEPPAVVTTRRVLTARPVYPGPIDVVTTGSVGHLPPIPSRRISKDVFAPAEHVVTTHRVAPASPVIIEERRIETIRRVIRPGVGHWD